MENKDKDIIRLGNYYDLHTGYHGPFLEYQDRYFRFKTTKPRVLCYLLKGNKNIFHPVESPFYFEVHKYPAGSKFIQSAFFPVSNQVPWVVDMDNICLPLYGNACFNRGLMRKLYKNYFKNPLYRKIFLARIRLYSSPFCKGILFHELEGIKIAISAFLEFEIDGTPEVNEFLSKIILAYPVMKPLITKIKLHEPRTILFMARDFKNKGGDIALAAFQKLYEHDPHLNLIYCGPIPDKYKKDYADLLAVITYYPAVDHEQALFLLKKSDIFILPTQFEALGITLIETKAAGCVPVTYYGKGLEAMQEIIENKKTGILIRKPRYIADTIMEGERFFKQIKRLLSDDILLVQMKQRALDEIVKGRFSFSNRITLLKNLFGSKTKRNKDKIYLSNYKLCSYSASDFNKMIWNYCETHRIPRSILV